MAAQSAAGPQKKRLMVLCDGTWMNSDRGWSEGGKTQIASNVTTLSRALRRQCSEDTVQIIYYQAGVGTGPSWLDTVKGGAFGIGVAENIRSAYAFVCANYVDGDEIVLVGFSRGAFTARSVAGMISNLGLLTRRGMELFYPIFKDMENWQTDHYADPFPHIPFDNKPRGDNAAEEYKNMLLKGELTRVRQNEGRGPPITVKAVGVWDTVGSLGIPKTWLEDSWLGKMFSMRSSSMEYRFFDTKLSDRIEHAFQALALDEHRPSFSPTLWEQTDKKKFTDLRQVWFPGNHGNIGGGWADSGISNMSLAWMMDQLASVGVEFDEATVAHEFDQLVRYYELTNGGRAQIRQAATAETPQDITPQTMEDVIARARAAARDNPWPSGIFGWLLRTFSSPTLHWASRDVYDPNQPTRPWAFGALLSERFTFTALLYRLSGHNVRTPGMYHRLNKYTMKTPQFLENTNERVHSSVRVRRALQGAGLNDLTRWDMPALKGHWKLHEADEPVEDPIPPSVRTWERQDDEGRVRPAADVPPPSPPAEENAADSRTRARNQRMRLQQPLQGRDGEPPHRYVWKYCGPQKQEPLVTKLFEESLGPYERELLRRAWGKEPNVWQLAEEIGAKE